MGKQLNITQIIFKNKIIGYVSSRYITYFIQFINSLFIAALLGPYYLGIWGFINLVLQYINQINFGIPHSVNVIVAINKNKVWYVNKVIGSAISMLLILSVLIGIAFIINEIFNFNIGSKYHFSIYGPIVILIGVLGYFNMLLCSIARIFGRLFEIAFSQTSLTLLISTSIIFFRGNDLLLALIFSNLIALIMSIALFLYRLPIKIRPIIDVRLFKAIQTKGWYLFIYNTSFYLILISTRSLVSAYYDVREFGFFTFAFTLSSTITLLLESFSYLIYPKLLNLFSATKPEKIKEIIRPLRSSYIVISHLLVHCAILLCPIFFFYFPKYSNSEDAFKIIALSQILTVNTFGYSEILIALGKEKRLGAYSFLSLCFNLTIAYLMITFLKPLFYYVIISTMLTYLLYILVVCLKGRKTINIKSNLIGFVSDIFPLSVFLPYGLSLLLILNHCSNWTFLVPVIIFIVLNYNAMIKLKQIVNEILVKPEMIDLA